MNDYKGYFDYAAATPLSKNVLVAMEPYFSDHFYNPSSIYLKSRTVRRAKEEARHTVAQNLGARPSEIIFTAGGSEANNLIIQGVMKQYLGKKVIVSAIEHDSVLKTAVNFEYSTVAVNEKGLIQIQDLVNKIDDDTVLVSVMYVNNEIGSIQPIKEIAEQIKQVRYQRRLAGIKTPIYFHTDACQAVNYMDINVARLGVDLMTINAGKIYGPKQVGAAYVKAGVVLQPLIYGGGQENGLRSGTENVAGIIGFALALTNAVNKHKSEARRLTIIRDEAFRLLEQLPNCQINGPRGNRRVANNIHISFPGQDNEYLLMRLDEMGFQVAVGSACSASSAEPSHVLTAIGQTEKEARPSLRITMGRFTDKEQVESLIKVLAQIVK